MKLHISFSVFFILIFSFLTNAILAQNHKAWTVSFLKQTSKLPSDRLFKAPFHPGVEVGFDQFLNQDLRHQFSFSLKLGYYFHRDFHHGVTFKPSINYAFVTASGIDFGTELNLGYLHTFFTDPVYQQNKNGEYQRVVNWGKPKFFPSLAFYTGYRFSQKCCIPFDFFIKYELGIETPFSKGVGVPVFPHSFINIGTRWYPSK